MATMQQTDKAQIELKRIVDLFSSKELPELITKVYLTPNNRPCSKWSLGNKLIMLTHDTVDARGFRQWQEVKRQVKKGSKAFYILAPNSFKIKEVDEKTKEETERIIIKGFRGIPVFRIEDTEGEEVKAVIDEPKQYPPLVEVAEKLGAKVRYDASSFGEYGSFNPETNEIRLCTPDQSTFFHELAHLAHKKIDTDLKPGQDSEQEIIAQLTACVIASMYGMNVEGYTFSYIKEYSKDKTLEGIGRQCMKVLSKVDEILKLILQ